MKFHSFLSPLPLCLLAERSIYDQRTYWLLSTAAYSSENALYQSCSKCKFWLLLMFRLLNKKLLILWKKHWYDTFMHWSFPSVLFMLKKQAILQHFSMFKWNISCNLKHLKNDWKFKWWPIYKTLFPLLQ